MRFRNTALHAACDRGKVALARKLLARGADLDAVGRGGWKPLLVAVYKGHTEVVRELLAAGANANDEQLPLHVAAEYGYEKIVALLLAHGASPTKRDARGRSARDLAAGPHIAALIDGSAS